MNLEFIHKFGSNGTGNTNFDTPVGFDFDGTFFYIADSANDRIVKYTKTGQYVSQFGSSGTGNDNFDNPRDILYWKGILYIADGNNHRIKLHKATDLSFVNTFGQQGTGTGRFNLPNSLARRGKQLFVLEYSNNRVQKFNIETFDYIDQAGSNGSGNSQLDQPLQIAYDSHEDTILIADNANTRILKWSASDLRYIAKVTTSTAPKGVAVDPNRGYIYVLESYTLKAYDAATLTSRESAGSDGSGNDNISSGVFVKWYPGFVVLSDSGNDRIMLRQDYDPTRDLTANTTPVIGGGWFSNPSIPIGGKQSGEYATIGGTSNSDLFRWKEENQVIKRYAWQEE